VDPFAESPGPAHPTAPARLASLPGLLLAVVLVLAAALRVAWFDAGARSPDEELYTRFARGLAREGPAWQVRLVHDFNRGADVDYPWQQRIGFTGLVALAQRATGDTMVTAGEKLSVAASLGAIATTAALAWEFTGPWSAVAATAFMAVSPLDLGLARRAWQDDVVMLVAVLMLAAWMRVAAGGSRKWWLLFFALATYGMTVKESLAIPAAFGTVGLAGLEWRRTRRWRDVLVALALGAAAAALSLAVIVAVSGGWSELRTTLALAREANAPDEYMRHYQTGGVFDYYVRGLLKLQAVPWLLAAGFTCWLAVKPKPAAPGPRARRALTTAAIQLVTFCGVACSYSSKNIRFLSPVYPAVALLAAAALPALQAAAARHGRRAGVAAAVALAVLVTVSCALDVRRFHHYFIEDEIQDLATPWFTQADAQDRADRAAADAGH
jgi:4-amino-4-deoxy-L-arabinose transferase-like glycosyltransferase